MRGLQICQVSWLDHVDLPQDEHDQLRAVVAELSLLFVLDNTELGRMSTMVLYSCFIHTLDTLDDRYWTIAKEWKNAISMSHLLLI